jgi:hypothetical protein
MPGSLESEVLAPTRPTPISLPLLSDTSQRGGQINKPLASAADNTDLKVKYATGWVQRLLSLD